MSKAACEKLLRNQMLKAQMDTFLEFRDRGLVDQSDYEIVNSAEEEFTEVLFKVNSRIISRQPEG